MKKGPTETGWPSIDYSPESFRPENNIGIKLGAKSNLIDIDLDSPELVPLAPAFLPATARFGRATSRSSHWIYRVEGGGETWKPARAKIELRGDAKKKGAICVQTVFPPSLHQGTGELIEWETPVQPTTVSYDALRASVAKLGLAGALKRLEQPLQEARGVHDFLLAFVGGLRRSGWSKDWATYLVEHSIGLDQSHREGCIEATFANEGEYTGWTTVEQLIGPPDAKMLKKLAEDPSHGFVKLNSSIAVEGVVEYITNDDGNADRLLDQFGESLRFAEGIGWLRFDGARWKRADGPWAEVSICARQVYEHGLAIGGPTGQALQEWGRKCGEAKRMRDCITVASHRSTVRVDPDLLDADPWLLNVKNGTLDLRTGQLRAHRRDDLLTKLCPVEYHPHARAPRFEQFLLECMGGDRELVLFMLRFLGYAMTGLTSEHLFGMWWGTGRNGKGTMINVLHTVLGDYVKTIAPEVLMMSRGSQHPTGLMDFKGTRIVTSNEVGEGRRWNEPLVKQLTGGDRIRARLMKQDFVEFAPTHTIIFAANARPIVREQSPAFWSRVSLLPWNVSFIGREDRKLEGKLADEASGILALLVAGCQAWQREGIKPPVQVVRAGLDYKESQDTMGMFLAETTNPLPGHRIPRTHLFQTYKMWCQNGNEAIDTASVFYRKLGERGLRQVKVNGVRNFDGLELKKGVGFG